MIKTFTGVVIAGALLAGCSGGANRLTELPVAKGPMAQVVDQKTHGPLACISAMKTRVSFSVLDVLDKTGAENRVGNDSFGTFMSQGTSDMLVSALATMRVPTIEVSPSFRAMVDWYANKTPRSLTPVQTRSTVNGNRDIITNETTSVPTAHVRTPDIGLVGAITTLDFIPGGHAGLSIAGIGGSRYKNAALASIDLRAVEMPKDGRPGGRTIAHATVYKQIVQDGTNVQLDRYMDFGPKNVRLVSLELGAQNREPMKDANRAMVNLAAAEVLAQVLKRYECMANPNIVVALN